MKLFKVLFILFPFALFSQSLTIADLTIILNKNGWYDIDSYVQNKNWDYYRSENTVLGSLVVWSYEVDYEKKALGWINVNLNDGKPEFVSYEFYNETSYKKCVSDLIKLGYKKGKDEVNDGQLIQIYFSDKYSLLITKSSNIDEQSDYIPDGPSTSYTVAITRKGSFYDPYNRHVVTYYDNSEQIEEDYYLEQGKIEGVYKRYFENGDIAVRSIYKNDIRNGKAIFYDENDHNLREEVMFVNGIKEGKKLHFEGDSLVQSYTMKSGVLNGPFYVWIQSDEGQLERHEGHYLDGELSGKLNVSAMTQKGLVPFMRFSYVRDERNGFMERYDGDTLTLKKNSGDILEGPCFVYLKKPNRPRDFDTTNCTLLEKSSYVNDQREGEYFKFDEFGNLRVSGYFEEDEPTGNWKFYNPAYKDSINDGLTSSANFLEGNLNGKKVTYLSTDYELLDCDDPRVNYVENDTCYRQILHKEKTVYNYKNDILNGEFSKFDKNGRLLRKGNYKEGKMHGEWYFNVLTDENTYEKIKVNYNNGSLEGKVISILGTDTLYIKEYKNDKLNGDWITFLNGKRSVIRNFSYGTLRTEKHLHPVNCIFEQYELFEYNANYIRVNANFCVNDLVVYAEYLIEYSFYPITLEENLLKDIIEVSYTKENILFDGVLINKDQNGKLLIKSVYKRNQLNGQRKTYDYKQQIVICEDYVNGQLLNTEFEFLNGDPFDGTYTSYDEESNRSYEIIISNGKKKKEIVYFGNFEKKLNVLKY
jgi:antitoxin component YwqK of YwqJK toxin-antitoxin module